MTDEMVLTLISKYSGAITCFCFMGGDSEPSEVERIAFLIKENYPNLKTAWYSGRTEIPHGFDISSLDFIKIGPYIEELGGLKSPKTNQALYRIDAGGELSKCSFK